MIAYPAISSLTGDRHAPEQVIGMAGLGDRHHPDSLIDFTGIRNLANIHPPIIAHKLNL
jgi:hypothetical protein